MASVWLIPLCCALTVFVAVGVKAADWNFDPKDLVNGPDNWYKFPGSESCSGKNQSPIDIDLDNTTPANVKIYLRNYGNSYAADTLNLTHNSYSITVLFPGEWEVKQSPYIQGGHLQARYKLVNIHFQWGSNSSQGSDHTVNGQTFPLEVHLVHYNTLYRSLEEASTKEQGIAVVVAFYDQVDADNPGLNSILKYFSRVKYKGDSMNIAAFNIYNVLGKLGNDFVYYDGSFNIPPCSEIVRWTIFMKHNTISESQLNMFRQLQKETKENDPNNDQPLVDNFRPVQPLNGRTVYRNKKLL